MVAKNIVGRYPDVFQGIGKLEGKVHLGVDPTVKPVVQSARRIPVTLRDELHKQLEEMEKLNIVAKVMEPTDWVSNVVMVKRNNKIRICIDPIVLNTALKRPHYQIPTINELLPELTNAKVFTTVDAKSGFWQVELDDESSRLTTFWTPFGRYRWLRMPFGISPAPEIFQRKLHEVTSGLKGVRVLADDVVIFGCGNTLEEALTDHNLNLDAFLRHMSEKNVKLNKDKIRLCQSNVKFFGHILTPNGVKVDPDKVRCILEMQQPQDVTALLRFLGMITYLTNYLPKLATVAEPLRRLTSRDAQWQWENVHQSSFDALKTMITQAPVLQYFDVHKDVVIQCDSSSVGLGAVLLQDGQPVCYASKTLSQTERRYAQIEKETLAILLACRKFEMYIIGKDVTVQTDHLPLLRIFQKPLSEAPMRLQRMLLGLQRYRLKLQFRPGKEVVIADMLSRAAIAEGDPTRREIYDIYTMDMDFTLKELEEINAVEYVPISDFRLNQIRRASTEDVDIQTIINFIVEGWPSSISDVPERLKAYWKYKEDLYTQNGFVYRNNRILIPVGIRSEILERLHVSHCGIEGSMKLARDTVFWPGINDQIRQRVQNCSACLKYSANQQHQPMQTHQIPSYPYQKVSLDLCEQQIKGKKHIFLVTVDHFSDFIDVDEIASEASARVVVQKCRKNFARYGTPMYVTTDGGPQFNSAEFRKFADDWEFKHSMSAPHHQQGNGKAEAAVKVVKQLLKKTSDLNSDFWMALQQWRNVPNNCGSSPAQRMFSRRIRFNIPMAEQNYASQIQEGVKEAIKRNRQVAKYYYDRSAKTLPPLQIGQPVFVKKKPDDRTWTPAVVRDTFNDRSTIVEVQGRNLRRDNIMVKSVPLQSDGQQKESLSKTEQHYHEDHSPTQDEPHSSQPETPYCTPRTSPIVQQPSAGRPKRQIRLPKRLEDYEVYQ